MKRTVSIIVFILCLLPFGLQAQDVTLISTGEGTTKELAIRNALVAAVEQAYGVYVSGNTKILNDELIRDEVVQIKRGNIKNYIILSEALLGNKTWSVILETTVSTDKLLKFAESKGAVCELAGKTFAANLKLYRLHVRNGAEAMKYLYGLLGMIAPKIYDYKLKLGEPIVYKSDVYIPVAVNCIPNENYETFIELYNSTYSSIRASIESVQVQGDTDDKNLSTIERYKQYIQYLPKIWAFGFELGDNNDNYMAPLLNASQVAMPDNAFWPSKGVLNFNIYRNHNGIRLYHKGENGTNEWIPHYYIIYNDEIVFFSKGFKIQQLDYEPLCSLSNGQGGGKVLRDYVRKLEQNFSVATTGVSYANDVYGIRDFDNRMVIWSNGKRKVNTFNWVDNPELIVGKPFCTVNFFLCYKEADIAKVENIKIYPIVSSSDADEDTSMSGAISLDKFIEFANREKLPYSVIGNTVSIPLKNGHEISLDFSNRQIKTPDFSTGFEEMHVNSTVIRLEILNESNLTESYHLGIAVAFGKHNGKEYRYEYKKIKRK